MADAPVLEVSPTDGRLDYAEGLDIGHRAYLRAGTEPAFWFGHGLGYTSWACESIDAADATTVTVRLRNTGDRAGKQVVQVYASRPDSAVERPVRWLAGFVLVSADPGGTVDVVVPIDPRALRHWDGSGWAVEPGQVTLAVGRSAGELLASTTVTL
jgi:beta-glucosidase